MKPFKWLYEQKIQLVIYTVLASVFMLELYFAIFFLHDGKTVHYLYLNYLLLSLAGLLNFFLLVQLFRLNKKAERLNYALWSSNQILFDCDLNHDSWYIDRGLENLLGYTPKEFPRNKAAFMYWIHPQDRVRIEKKLWNLWAGDIPVLIEECRLKNQKDHWCWVLIRAKICYRDQSGLAHRMIGTLMDITARKEADMHKFKKTEDKLTYLNQHDSLTRLPNRSYFMQQIETVLIQAGIQEKSVALVLIGIDNFKMINDSYGHELGDELLRTIAKRLLRFVNKEGFVSRITGDEFALVIEKFHSQQDLLNIALVLLELLGADYEIKEHKIMLSASLGISIFPVDGLKIDTLFLHADTALYYAKQISRNSFQFYAPEMNNQVQKHQQIQGLLKNAIEKNQFTVFYQAKVSSKSGKIISAEALLRWHTQELGWISPVDFIPVAEESGRIIQLGSWVLRTVCQQLKVWREAGFEDLRIAVNLSAHQFRQGDIVAEIANILWETKIPGYALELELTESVLMENAPKYVLMLKVLKAMGMKLYVDDFGTGYSSLSYLTLFPIDGLKIDKSFVQKILVEAEEASIVKAIVAMAKGLKIVVVAEGVENAQQVDYLRAEGVDEFQGYYYSKPLSAEEFIAKLKAKPPKFGSFLQYLTYGCPNL